MHNNYKKLLNSRSEAATCFECHPEQRTYLFKRSRHPLTDSSRRNALGKMRCSSCHNPHGTQSEKLIDANSINDKPVVVDFRVDAFEKVYPMVPAGGSNDDIILGPEGDADAKAKGTAPS